MTTEFLAADISRDEGYRAQAYPDPLSPLAKTGKGSGEPWTCGFGCTAPDIRPGTIWTLTEAAKRRDAKIAECIAELDRNAPWWRSLSDARQDVLANMAFNLGWPRLSGFKKMLAAAQAGDFDEAARQMAASTWAVQVHSRATRLAAQMKTGVRQA